MSNDGFRKPDILDCFANLSPDDVFTSPKLANQVLDMLPQELFENPDTKFLDPCCKSGVFLREIAKRLIKGLENQIPNLQERLDNIYKKQIFGLATTELTSLISRRTLYCSQDASSEYSVCKFDNPEGEIKYEWNDHFWIGKDDSCHFCKASRKIWDRPSKKERHAYSFIHTNEYQKSDLFKRLKEMKFDVIIGNPPYQLDDGGNAASASPLYHYFVEQAKKLNPRYITMIIPARWYAGGKGLDNFRDSMLKDDRIRIIHDHIASFDCFPGVPVEGGVCYFLWDRDNRGNCLVYTHKNKEIISSMERPLLEEGNTTFIRYNEAISILRKVKALKERTMDNIVSSRKPFGFATNFTDFEKEPFEGAVKIYANSKIGYVRKSQIAREFESVNKYKVYISKAYGYGSNATFPHQIINKPFVAENNSCCTETYLMIGPFDNEEKAKRVCDYFKTLFFRFLVLLKKNTQDNPKGVFSFVPIQDFNEEWTDEKLYLKYGLTQEEINFIESMVKPME